MFYDMLGMLSNTLFVYLIAGFGSINYENNSLRLQENERKRQKIDPIRLQDECFYFQRPNCL